MIDVTFAFLVDTLHVKCVQFFIRMLANIGYKKSFDKLDIILIGVKPFIFLYNTILILFLINFFHVLKTYVAIHVKVAKNGIFGIALKILRTKTL